MTVDYQNGQFNQVIWICGRMPSNRWHFFNTNESKATISHFDQNNFSGFFCTDYIHNGRIFSIRGKHMVRLWICILYADHWNQQLCDLLNICLAIEKYVNIHRKLRGLHCKEWVKIWLWGQTKNMRKSYTIRQIIFLYEFDVNYYTLFWTIMKMAKVLSRNRKLSTFLK